MKKLVTAFFLSVSYLVPSNALSATPELKWQDYEPAGYSGAITGRSATAEYALTTRLEKVLCDESTSPVLIESYLERLISICAFQNKLDVAHEYCKQALKFADKHKLDKLTVARLHAMRAGLLLKERKFTQAELEYETARNMQPATAPAEQLAELKTLIDRGLAQVYIEQKRFSLAEPIYLQLVSKVNAPIGNLEKLLKPAPQNGGEVKVRELVFGDGRDFVWLAKCLAGQGRLDEARDQLLRALAIDRSHHADDDPAIASELNDLACVFFQQEKFDDAEKCMATALEMSKKRRYSDLNDWKANMAAIDRAKGKSASVGNGT
jgi:tetratricopeptide (TPR) repeat protein